MTNSIKSNSEAVTIHYWSGIYVDKTIKSQLSKEQKVALRNCFENPLSVRFEKLRGHQNIFSIRYGSNKAGRILLTDIDGKLVVLAILPTHNYKRELLKLESGVLKHFNTMKRANSESVKLLFDDNNNDNSQEDKDYFEETNDRPNCLSDSIASLRNDNEIEDNDNDDNDKERPSCSIDFKQVAIEAKAGDRLKTLVLDNEQEAGVKTVGPTIISGLPGSGKTTVAMELLNEAELLTNDQMILFTSQGAHLVDSAREGFRKVASKQAFNKVKFATYSELLSDDDNEIKIIQGRQAKAYVINWLEGYIKQHSKAIKIPFSNKDTEKLYQEFRVRSGYTSEEYLDIQSVGKKQSLFMEHEQRAWIDGSYQKLLSDLKAGPIRLAEFMPIPGINNRKEYYKVVLDEAQNLSNCQLKSASKLAINGNAYYLYGDGQCLEDAIPSKIYIERLYPSPMIVQSVILKFPYRCPKNVMLVASKINNLRIDLTPKNKREHTFDNACEHIENEGEVLLSNTKKSPQALERIRSLVTDRLRTCVITHPNLVEKAQSLYGAKGFQVYSPEEIIGLQYENVIIYEPFLDESFSEINKEMGRLNPIRNSDFTKSLSQLFVALARSEDTVILDSSIYRNNLTSFMEQCIAQAKAATSPSEAKPSSQPFQKSNIHTVSEYRRIAEALKGEEQLDKLKGLLSEAKTELSKNGVDEFVIAQFLSKYEPQPEARRGSTNSNSSFSATSSISSKTVKPKKETESNKSESLVLQKNAKENLAEKRKLIESKMQRLREQKKKTTKDKSPPDRLKSHQGRIKRPYTEISQIATPSEMPEVNLKCESIIKFGEDLVKTRIKITSEFSKPQLPVRKSPTKIVDVNGNKLLSMILKKKTKKAKIMIGSKKINLNYIQNSGEHKGCSALFLAAITNQPTLVIALRKTGVFNYKDTIVNSGPYDKMSALSAACEKGFDKVVNELLADGFVDIKLEEINCAKHGSPSPLALACMKGEFKCAKLLVENNADLKLHNHLGLTPLFCAVKANHLELVKYLVRNGADVNQTQTKGAHEGETPLERAVLKKNVPIAKYLIENNANKHVLLSSGLDKGSTLLLEAVHRNDIPLIEMLLEAKVEIDRVVTYGRYKGNTALSRAVISGKQDIVEILLKAKSNPNQTVQAFNFQGRPLLHIACSYCNKNIAKHLLNYGAFVDAQVTEGNMKGTTALFTSSARGRLSLIELLLDQGANIDANQGQGNSYKQTALYIAAAYNQIDAVRLLLDRGANVNLRQGSDYVYMLPVIAASGNAEVVQILLDAGIQVHAPSLNEFKDYIYGNKKVSIQVEDEVYGNNKVSIQAQDEIYGMIIKAVNKQSAQPPLGEHLTMFNAIKKNNYPEPDSEKSLESKVEVSTHSFFPSNK